MAHVITIIGLNSGEPTEFDNQYLVEYDPTDTTYISPRGESMIARIVTTPDPNKAKVYNSLGEAVDELNQSFGVLSDGRPNRPLTAFSVTVSTHRPEMPQ